MGTIIIPDNETMHQVPFTEIIRVEALSNYSRVYFANGKKLVVAKVLLWFQEKLPAEYFARIHRSHLVNKHFIKGLLKSDTGILELQNGEQLCISRRKRASFHTFYSINKSLFNHGKNLL